MFSVLVNKNEREKRDFMVENGENMSALAGGISGCVNVGICPLDMLTDFLSTFSRKYVNKKNLFS